MQAEAKKYAKPRYVGATCAYCGIVASSEGPDHIFARGIFPVEERNNLPRVPACRKCNGDKAKLEHYLLTVLPFGGETKSSSRMLTEAVPGRLAQNLRLHRELSEGRIDVRVKRGEEVLPTFAIPIDVLSLFTLTGVIARGLVAFHWKSIVPNTHVSRAGMFTPAGEKFMKDLFRKPSAAVAQGRLGADTILYEGVQAVDDPFLTIWRFRLYGGMMFAGDPKAPSQSASDIWATTSRPEVANFFDLD